MKFTKKNKGVVDSFVTPRGCLLHAAS